MEPAKETCKQSHHVDRNLSVHFETFQQDTNKITLRVIISLNITLFFRNLLFEMKPPQVHTRPNKKWITTGESYP